MSVKLYGNMMNFQNGLNKKDNANLLLETELTEVFNAVIGMGFVSKRNGFVVNVEGEVQSTLYLWNQFGFKNWSDV